LKIVFNVFNRLIFGTIVSLKVRVQPLRHKGTKAQVRDMIDKLSD
jgi:hypothetical protein